MEPDITKLGHQSGSPRNDFLLRELRLPRCARYFFISDGPGLRRILDAPMNFVGSSIPSFLGSKASQLSLPQLVADHVPLEFRISESGRGGTEFPLWVWVRSIDLKPDPDPWMRALTSKHFPVGGGKYEVYVAVRGWCAVSPALPSGRITLPKGMKKGVLGEFLMFYDPFQHEGMLGEVDEDQVPPTSGVVKDIVTLERVISESFVGGFVEFQYPKGKCWVRISSAPYLRSACMIFIDAMRKAEKPKGNYSSWEYYPKDNLGALHIGGVSYPPGDPAELSGDVFLCSDGTLLHTYQDEGEYCSSRFYPPSSPMVPQEVIQSYQLQMPIWRRDQELAVI